MFNLHNTYLSCIEFLDPFNGAGWAYPGKVLLMDLNSNVLRYNIWFANNESLQVVLELPNAKIYRDALETIGGTTGMGLCILQGNAFHMPRTLCNSPIGFE